jgi:hypothetical protein
MCANNLAIILKNYPPEIAEALGYKIIKSLDKEQLSNLAQCDASKFKPKYPK